MKRLVLPFLLAAALHAGERVPQGLNQFGISCYQQLAQRNGNIIFSPFSIANALSMALAGARGPTAAGIASVLHQDAAPGYAGAFQSLAASLDKAGNSAPNEFRNANALWVQEGLKLKTEFQSILRDSYGAEPAQLDFAKQTEQARAAINSWTDSHTKGRIPELFAPGSLHADTRLILTSAVYFYGKWAKPFETRNTHPGPFRLGAGGASVQTPFMSQTSRFNYAETATLQILEMSYAGTGFALDVLLPKTGANLKDVEKSLTEEDFTAWIHQLHDATVDVEVPKFRAEAEFSLRQPLTRMGMGAAFRGADFSGIDGHPDLTLSDVLHKAFVDVSERGTEAAAATGSVAVLARLIVPDKVVFHADHPFLFFIRDTQSGLILFAGRLENPQR